MLMASTFNNGVITVGATLILAKRFYLAIKNGTCAKILARWQLSEEALPESRTDPPGLSRS
jgi:hypothetical protein